MRNEKTEIQGPDYTCVAATVTRLQAAHIALVFWAGHENKASSYPSKKVLFVLSKEWTDVVNARASGSLANNVVESFSSAPSHYLESLSHYLIGNATSSPDSRIETYSYVLTPISVLNICLHMLVSGEKKDDNAVTTLAVLLIYGCDTS